MSDFSRFPTAAQYGKDEFAEFPKAEQYIGPSEPLPSNVVDDPARMASTPRQAAGSLPTDELTKVRYLASRRFPDLPPEAAMDRYFYKDNRLAYKDADGKAYFEEPVLSNPLKSGGLRENAKLIASGAGPAMAPIGGTLAALPSMLQGPLGFLTGVPQATAGGAGADVFRQFLANQITGEEKPFMERALQTGGAGLEQGIAQIVGNTVGKIFSFLGKTPTYDIPETTALREKAQKFDIPLTPGEETGNRTLLRRQKILQNTTEGEMPFTNFYEGRNEKVGAAVNNILNRVSPNASPRMASESGVEGAQAAIETANRALSREAKPLYDQAESGVVPLDQLTGGPAGGRIKLAIDAVKRKPVYKDTIGTAPDDSIPVVDAAKRWLDDKVKAATKAGNTNEARLWNDAADELRTIADANVPVYGQARGTFEAGVPARNAVTRGLTADVAKLEGNDTLRAGGIMFNPKTSSPEDVRLARQAFSKAGSMDKWNDLVRSHLQQTFASIPESSTGAITNLGGTYRKAVFGNTPKRQILEAALEHDPQVMADFKDLMTVLDATGRAMKGESITAFAQAGQKELANEAKGIAPRLLETVEIWKTPSRVAQYWSDLRTGKYAARQAELLTTPEGRAVMRELKQFGPTSKASIMTLSHFLTTGGVGAAEDAMSTPKNGPVSKEPTLVRPIREQLGLAP